MTTGADSLRADVGEPLELPAEARAAMDRLRAAYRSQARLLQRPGCLLVGVVAILAHLGAGAAAGALTVWLWHRSPLAAAIAYPLAVVFIATRLRALGNLLHECSHRMFVRGAAANRVLGHVLSFVVFTDFAAYVDEHLTHHRHLGDPERDRDFAVRRALFARLGPLGPAYVRTALLLGHLPLYLRPVVWSRGDTVAVRIARLGFLVGLAALGTWVTGWVALGALFAVPYATAYQALRFWSDATDHAGVIAAADVLDRSRNHGYRAAWLNWLVFPRHDQYHLVHHLFPSVTTRHLPRVHALLLADPVYANRTHDLASALAGAAAT